MEYRLGLVALFVTAVVICQVASQAPCSNRNPSCDCGQVCRMKFSETRCVANAPGACLCDTGCIVFNKFIEAGSGRHVYGNRCNCPKNPAQSYGIPLCTRARWWRKPAGVSTYTHNC